MVFCSSLGSTFLLLVFLPQSLLLDLIMMENHLRILRRWRLKKLQQTKKMSNQGDKPKLLVSSAGLILKLLVLKLMISMQTG